MGPSEPPEPFFRGREELLAKLSLQSADQLSRFVVVTGLGGGGKSRIAVDFRQQRAARAAAQRIAEADVDLFTFVSSAWQGLSVEAALDLAARVDPVEAAAAVRSAEEDPDANAIVDEVSTKIRSAKVAGLTHLQLLLLILTWLVAIGIPFAAIQLPASDQVVAADEIATVGLALVITDRIRKQH